MKAILMLEDGKSFTGEGFGAGGERVGEVILNSSVVGYQEMMTDPANAGKILVLTYPLIGNYGVAPKFNESRGVWIAGLAIKESSRTYSNWQAKASFDSFIKERNILAARAVDTRSLAVYLRQKGEMLGVISTKEFGSKELLSRIQEFKKGAPGSALPRISVSKATRAGKGSGKYRIAIVDLGVANSTIEQLERLGCSITLLPYNSSASEIMRLKPAGLVISNGPEDDPGLKEVTGNIKSLLGKLPILGISTGHQVLAGALGAKLTKLKLGHRGVNQPIHNPASYKGEITVQNHGYIVDADSLNKIKGVKVTAYNLNDRTVEGIESKRLKAMGIQYYPASPGFNEVNGALKKFIKMLKRSR
ncbi:MAG: glutamine-hydrolyzing carbamoyl-phosphate synthase small subunit [Candidatus Omnitrophota bacterium]|jgi:carbamoyl-phosphate synthase small subunit